MEYIASILVALITGGLSLIGVILSNRKAAQDMNNEMTSRQAVTDTKIEELTREVRLHNGFATRVPTLESQMEIVIERINTLEQLHRK